MLPSFPPRTGRRFSVGVTQHLPPKSGSLGSPAAAAPRVSTVSSAMTDPVADASPHNGAAFSFSPSLKARLTSHSALGTSTRRSSHVPRTGRRFSVGVTQDTLLPSPVASVPLPQLPLVSRLVAHTMPHIRTNSLASGQARFSLCPDPEGSAPFPTQRPRWGRLARPVPVDFLLSPDVPQNHIHLPRRNIPGPKGLRPQAVTANIHP